MRLFFYLIKNAEFCSDSITKKRQNDEKDFCFFTDIISDDILLSKGFIVENGATFAVKTPGKVTIDGCVFRSGAHVRIDAGKVEISGNHATQFDAAVQINQYVE